MILPVTLSRLRYVPVCVQYHTIKPDISSIRHIQTYLASDISTLTMHILSQTYALKVKWPVNSGCVITCLLPDSSVLGVLCACGTITVMLPSPRHRPAHWMSCSMLYGSPTITTSVTDSKSIPVAAQDVATKILQLQIDSKLTSFLFRLVTTTTHLY